jgi:hypothetical protein
VTFGQVLSVKSGFSARFSIVLRVFQYLIAMNFKSFFLGRSPLVQHHKNEKQGVYHTVALPFTLKIILRQKKNYGNSIFHHAKIYLIFTKNPLKETKILQDTITL